jgi:hypothetical protein
MATIRSALVLAFGCAACTHAIPTTVAPASCVGGTDGGAPSATDRDQDGLDDAMELAWAQQYLPFFSLAPDENCPTSGIVVRVSPHPTAGFVHIIYDVLYNDDCGLEGHVGDDERFALTINPSMPPPLGIVSIKGIAHKGTFCEKSSECGRCPGETACATLPENGTPWPAVWASKDKHSNYVNRAENCEFTNTCLDQCNDRSVPVMPAIVNVGEPCHPLVSNLTTMGFITTQNGWTHQELFNYDPWGGQFFGGGGGMLSADLTDPALDTPACP